MNQESNFFTYLTILLQWRRFIIINFLIVAFSVVGISLLLPNWYKATTTLLPPKQPDVFGNLGGSSSFLKGISGLGKLGGLGQKSGAYNYFAILKSRSTMEKVIHKFDLVSIYNVKDRSVELTIKELASNVNFEDETDDNISIQVYDKDPIRAADMANYFVEVLNEVNTKLSTQEARTNKEFIEQRLEQCKTDLRTAEDALRKYQEKTGMMIAADEKNSSLGAYAELYAMKVKKDIEVAVMQKSVSADDSYLRQLKFEISELNHRLDEFPSAGLESFRLYRDVVTQQRILEFILPIYEQAKIDEQKDMPVLLVLDKAFPPERKSKPQRSLIVIVTSSLSLLFLAIVTFLLHGFVQQKNKMNNLDDKLQKYALQIAAWFKVHFQ